MIKQKRDAALESFLARAPLEESVVTLDGTGVNGGLQYLVLHGLGHERLQKLQRINIFSGSAFAYLSYFAWREGLFLWNYNDMSGWNKANHEWHDIGVKTHVERLLRFARARSSFFPNSCLAKVLHGTIAETFCNRLVTSLPKNVVFWLYDIEAKEFRAVSPIGFGHDFTLTELACSVAAVPKLYEPGCVLGKKYSDAVYAPQFRKLLKELRAGSKNHLFSNMKRDGISDSEVLFKPHEYEDGSRMINADFMRFLLGLSNPRIRAAHDAAFS